MWLSIPVEVNAVLVLLPLGEASQLPRILTGRSWLHSPRK
jgi:hypothetical protein